jgi:hypothetical protein
MIVEYDVMCLKMCDIYVVDKLYLVAINLINPLLILYYNTRNILP